MSITYYTGWAIDVEDSEVLSVLPEFHLLYVVPVICGDIGYFSIQGVVDEGDHTLAVLVTRTPVRSEPWKRELYIFVFAPHCFLD